MVWTGQTGPGAVRGVASAGPARRFVGVAAVHHAPDRDATAWHPGPRTPSARPEPTYAGRGADRRGWLGPTALLLVLAGVFATGAGLGRSDELLRPLRAASTDHGQGRDQLVLEPSRPVQLVIPAIRVRAPVDPVGLAADGSIAVPPLERHNRTGWYDRGPTPGQDGPAIIVGHSDTRTGPSVFHDLRKLRPGDRIEVVRQDRTVAVFAVDSVEHFDKAALPADRVYGDFHRPGLRLITCGGPWVGGSIGYSDNVVAFASLVDARKQRPDLRR